MKTSAQDNSAELDPQRWRALAVCLIAGFMILLDGSMINVALPSIQPDLHLSSIEVTWAVSGYALAFGLTLVAAGRLGDDLGRRRIFTTGLVLFVIASLFRGAAQSGAWLVASRFGVGLVACSCCSSLRGYCLRTGGAASGNGWILSVRCCSAWRLSRSCLR